MGILKGKVALVTGASRGVGAAVARSLAEESAAVTVNYRKSERRGGGRPPNPKERGRSPRPPRRLTHEAAVGEMVHAVTDAFGAVDILVNNALPNYKFEPVARK